ncbi:MAG: lactate utilization protein [Thermomicrobiales bacterium]
MTPPAPHPFLAMATDPLATPPRDEVVDRHYELFRARAGALGVTVARMPTAGEAAAMIGDLAREVGHRTAIVSGDATGALPVLAGVLAGLGVSVRAAADPALTRDAPLGISWAETAIAETGSVLLAEATLADRAVGMLVATQVVLCPASGLRGSLEDAADALRAMATRPGGSFATLVTGPSRTADIERVLTVGVQGPSRLVVIFIDEPGP